jgi:Uri superfamily endonuclease
MNSARVYQQKEFWFVDFIDNNYELLPAVGIFKTQEEANSAAEKWKNEEALENMGKSLR